jgi:hypothetical protein
MKYLTFIITLLIGSTLFAAEKTCELATPGTNMDKIAVVEYSRRTVIKNILLTPSLDAYYEEQTYVDSCIKINRNTNIYECINPIRGYEIVASFNGQKLTIKQTLSGNDIVYNCK